MKTDSLGVFFLQKRIAYNIMLTERTKLINEERNAALQEKRKERNPFNKIADYYSGLTQIYNRR